MKKHKYKSRITKRLIKHSGHLLLAVFLLISGLSLGKIGGTNAFFTDSATISGNNFSAGFWIPVLTYTVEKPDPDGENGFYKTTPCVTLTVSATDKNNTEILYRLKDSGDYAEYSSGTCVSIPDGDWNFEAYAIFDNNNDWKSNPVSQNFKVNSSLVESDDVIINEVMWMGSQSNDGVNHTGDEWIELYNTTGHDINIKNWNIYGAVTGVGGHLEIAGNASDPDSKYIIHSHDYYLISNNEKSNSGINEESNLVKTSINFDNYYDDNGQIILEDISGNIIDKTTSAPSDHNWPAGKNENHQKWSMERNEDGNGWHTCDSIAMSSSDLATMKGYWDNNANEYNCGTPGHENLSDNDPSHVDEETVADTIVSRGEIPVDGVVPVVDGVLPEDPAVINDPIMDETNSETTGDSETLSVGDVVDPPVDPISSNPPAINPPPAESAPVDPPAETSKIIEKIVAPEPAPVEPAKEPEKVKAPDPPKEEPKEEPKKETKEEAPKLKPEPSASS